MASFDLNKIKDMINMRFIRKNVFLVGFIAMAAIGSLALLVMSVIQFFEMSESIEKTNSLREKNDKLIRRRVPAVKENIDRIQENITGFEKLEKETAIYYGQPLYPALKAFCDVLKVTPEELRENFKRFYDEENFKNEKLASIIYKKFRDSQGRGSQKTQHAIWVYDDMLGADGKNPKKLPVWEDAFEIFKKKAQATTEEKIESHNEAEIFLSALGVPRNMGDSDNAMLNFRRKMIERISDMFNAEGTDIDILGVNFFLQNDVPKIKKQEEFNDKADRVKKSGTEQSNNSAGSSNSSEKVSSERHSEILHWDIVCDLSRRLCDAKIVTIENISYKDLNGQDSGNCKLYTYTLSITGSEDSLRKLLSNLNAAYKDHRVYVVKNLSIAKQKDQIQDILDFANQRIGVSQNTSEMQLTESNNFAGSNNSGKVALEDEFFKETHKYPECVAGHSNIVSATLVIDYVVYNISVK